MVEKIIEINSLSKNEKHIYYSFGSLHSAFSGTAPTSVQTWAPNSGTFVAEVGGPAIVKLQPEGLFALHIKSVIKSGFHDKLEDIRIAKYTDTRVFVDGVSYAIDGDFLIDLDKKIRFLDSRQLLHRLDHYASWSKEKYGLVTAVPKMEKLILFYNKN